MKRFSHALIAALTFTSLAACGAGETQTKAAKDDATVPVPELKTTSETARQEWIEGARELDMGRFETGYEHLKRAVAADPNMVMAELYAGLALFAIGDLEGASAHYTRAAELAKNGTEAEKMAVSSSQKTLDGDNEGALADALKLVKLDPNQARWYNDIVFFAYDILDKVADSRVAIAKAVELAPEWAGAWAIQSYSYATREPLDLAKAEQSARKATELEPNDPNVWDILGDAQRAQGRLEEAAQSYTKCAELDPTRAEGLQQRGHVQSFLGRFAEARADYDAAAALTSPAQKYNLGRYRPFVYLHAGDPKAAVAELEEMFASVDGANVPDPNGSKQLLLNTGILPIVFYYRMVPEAEKAVAQAAQVAEQQMQKIGSEGFRRNTRAGMAINQGHLAFAKGDYAGARSKAQESVSIRGGDLNSPDNRNARMLLGYVAQAQGNHQEAVRMFEQGNTNDMRMVYAQAQSLEALGRTAEAQKLYERIATYYFNSVEAAMVRGEALKKLKKPAA